MLAAMHSDRSQGKGSRVVMGSLLLGSGGLGVAGLASLLSWRDALRPALGPGFGALLFVLALASAAGPAALLARRSVRAGTALFLRSGVVLLVAAQLFLLCAFPGTREPWVASTLGIAGGLIGALAWLRPSPPASWPRPARGMELSVFVLALSILALELGLELLDTLVHPALLADTTSARAWITSRALPPGTMRFGFPVNSRGHYDVEPPAPGSGPLVVVIGDSFGPGTVPHSMHYTSVAEEILRPEFPGLEIYNMGIPGADPSHYLEMLSSEALPMHPDLVVIALFVGNDLEFPVATPGSSSLASRAFGRESNLLARFVTRSLRLIAERRRAHEEGALGGKVQGDDESGRLDPEEALATFPQLADPLLEVPTFSTSGFARIERGRALDVTTGSEDYRGLPWILRMRDLARSGPEPVPLFVLLIPDEFQVEDEVWELARPDDPEAERDRPQRVLTRFLAEHEIPCLDPLPALRALEPLADGRLHAYHARDTHWNMRGNRVGGTELARAIRPWIRR